MKVAGNSHQDLSKVRYCNMITNAGLFLSFSHITFNQLRLKWIKQFILLKQVFRLLLWASSKTKKHNITLYFLYSITNVIWPVDRLNASPRGWLPMLAPAGLWPQVQWCDPGHSSPYCKINQNMIIYLNQISLSCKAASGCVPHCSLWILH